MVQSTEPAPQPPIPGVLGAVLAGGGSRRMGVDKALLELGGRSLLERAVEALGAVVEQVVVVAPARSGYRELCREAGAAGLVADRVPDQGPLGGLDAALHRAAGRPVLLLACDLPFAGPELLRWLLARPLPPLAGRPPAARVPVEGGRRQPLCAWYAADCRGPVEEALAAGRRSLHGLLDRLTAVEAPVGPELPFYRPDLLLNVNRPKDLGRAAAVAEGKRLTRIAARSR